MINGLTGIKLSRENGLTSIKLSRDSNIRKFSLFTLKVSDYVRRKQRYYICKLLNLLLVLKIVKYLSGSIPLGLYRLSHQQYTQHYI